ncbi:MAG: gamma-glutamylcyclotransferase family protein [Halobacteria archaeon]|nr:gamma-glutamylcyclotransferase family protein [Halobacteria archaeon]
MNVESREPRKNVAALFYGSLMNPEQATFTDSLLERAEPVVVDGYRRVCNKRASWRDPETGRDGVFNIVESEGSYLNAVAMTRLTHDELGSIAVREGSYEMRCVDEDRVSSFDGESARIEGVDCFVVAMDPSADEEVEPIPQYVDVCLEGARNWGEDFYDVFVETTPCVESSENE